MDLFQIKFWKSRQAEWEPYTYQYSPLKIEQGKLTDPLYFDFISYVQLQTVVSSLKPRPSHFAPLYPSPSPPLPHTTPGRFI